MKKELFKHLMMVVLMTVMSIGFVACGDDDDEPYDPANPIVGAWQCIDIDNVRISSPGGALEIEEGQWASNFIKDWTGRTVKFDSNTIIEDNTITIETTTKMSYHTRIDRVTYYIQSVDENTLVASYHLDRYQDEIDRNNLEWVESATLTFKRK